MFIVKTTEEVVTETSYDLMAMPATEWPASAKAAAMDILSNAHWRDLFFAELPAMRKSWIVSRIERQRPTIKDL